MIELEKCVKDNGCIIIILDGHVSLMREEDQKYFIGWMKKNKPELI
jgi:hypothetical protein